MNRRHTLAEKKSKASIGAFWGTFLLKYSPFFRTQQDQNSGGGGLSPPGSKPDCESPVLVISGLLESAMVLTVLTMLTVVSVDTVNRGIT